VIDLFFEHRHRIALVRFAGDLTTDHLARLQVAARHFTGHERVVRRILDFTDVVTVQVKASVFASMGMGLATTGERIYVVPNPEVFGLARLYSTYQQHAGGNSAPRLVATLAEACTAFGLDAPDFQPYLAMLPPT
jgi:hypothetical protein